MYQQDYILRQIEMLGSLLRRMLQSIREGRTGEPLEMIDEIFEDIAGSGPDLIDALPVEGLLAMLSAGGQLDEGRTALLGMLLLERATAYEAVGDLAAAASERSRGSALLAAIPAEADPEMLGAIRSLRVSLEDGAVSLGRPSGGPAE